MYQEDWDVNFCCMGLDPGYRVETLRAHEYNKQDGVYHLICIDSSISPTVNEFTDARFNQNIENLYPQFDGDKQY